MSKLVDAMRLGIKNVPEQCFSHTFCWIDPHVRISGSEEKFRIVSCCAMGAPLAPEVNSFEDLERMVTKFPETLRLRFPELNTKRSFACPNESCDRSSSNIGTCMTLLGLGIHLNDVELWTREAIADYFEVLLDGEVVNVGK